MHTIDLSNSLKVIVLPSSSCLTTIIGAVSLGGRRYEPKPGMAHLLEHLLFSGTESYGDYEQLDEFSASHGISKNASVGAEYISCWVRSLPEECLSAADLLIEMLQKCIIPEGAIQKEYNNIAQEVTKRKDSPIDLLSRRATEASFEGSSLCRTIFSDVDLEDVPSRVDMQSFYRQIFTSNQSIIYIAGNFDSHTLNAITDRFLKYPPATTLLLQSDKTIVKSNISTILPFSGTMEYLSVVFAGPSLNSNDSILVAFLAFIVGGGTTSILFNRLRRNLGVSYSPRCRYVGYSDAGLFAIETDCKVGHLDEAEAEIRRVCLEFAQKSIPAEELERKKSLYLSTIAAQYDDIKNYAITLAKQLLLGDQLQSFEVIKEKVSRLSCDDVRDFMRRITSQEPNVTVLENTNK